MRYIPLYLIPLALLLTAVMLLGACFSQSSTDGLGTPPRASGELDPHTLVIALLPDEDPAAILQHHQPFSDYLQARLGKEIKLVIHHDYSIMVEAMRSGDLHLAYFGPATYIVTKDSGAHIEPFAAKKTRGSTTYTSLIIAPGSSEVSSLEELAGKRMAYGDPGSTSSHLIPKFLLLEAGLRPNADYHEVFLGAHDAVALNVAQGNADAGGLSASIYRSLLQRGVIQEDQTRIIQESPPFPQYPWTMRSDLSPALKQA
ncbi:MAG: phosphate/phosphite/phosphonate ABC transporter substrate-binding protein, partial [Planctomycetota bacterium]